jgi:hypothetical protein
MEEIMNRKIVIALYASTLLLPVSALAQSATNDPCDELLRSLPERSTLTREQVEAYKADNNLEACQTALSQIKPTETQSTEAADSAGAETPQEGKITVEGGAPNVNVEQAAPQITVEQPPSQVTVQQGQPAITVRQPAPIITVEIPAPEITFSMPTPEVGVTTPEPRVSVKQAEPEVHVTKSPDNAQADIQAQAEQPQPIINYQAEEAKVTVTQADKPVVRFEQQASTDQQPTAQDQSDSQDVAAKQDRASEGTAPTDDDQAAAAGGDEIQVSRLQGMQVMAPNNQGNIGTVTSVIIDAKQRPFVIIRRGNEDVAVMVEQTRLNGDTLVVQGISDANQLPVWDPDSAEAANVKELSGNQTVIVRGAS